MNGMIWVHVKRKDVDYLTKMNYDDWCDRLVIEGKKKWREWMRSTKNNQLNSLKDVTVGLQYEKL